MTSLASDVADWLLVYTAIMLWVGWTLLPVRKGERFVSKLSVSTEYVTCLVRFCRAFFGLGQVVLATRRVIRGGQAYQSLRFIEAIL